MKQPPTRFRRWLGYGITALAGWGLVAFATVPTRDAQQTVAREGKRPARAESFLDQMLRQMKDLPKIQGAPSPLNRAAELKDTLAPADDVAAAAREAMTRAIQAYSTEGVAIACVRLLHWLRVDPEAAYAFLGSGYGEMRTFAEPEFLKELGKEGLLKIMEQPGELGWRGNLLKALTSQLSKDKDVTRLMAFSTRLEGDQRRDFLQNLAKEWPKEDRAGMLELARTMNAPELVYSSAKDLPFDQAVRLVEEAMASSQDPDFIKSLQHNDNLAARYLYDTSLSVEDRIAGAMRFGHSREEATRMLVLMGSRKELPADDGRGYHHLYAAGDLSADEALARMAQSIPEVNAAAPDQVRLGLFRELAVLDGGRAMQLLETLPPAARSQAVFDLLKQGGGVDVPGFGVKGQIDPRQAYELFKAIPYDAETSTDRSAAWDGITLNSYTTHGEGYTEWVRSLPPGPDHDLAMASLIRQLETSDPVRAAELRAGESPTKPGP